MYTVQYYDLVLAGIILSLTAGVAIGALTSVSMPLSVVSLGGVSIAFMGHAMFVRGPVDDFEDLTEEVDLEDASVPLAD
jgi:hypothetical protein